MTSFDIDIISVKLTVRLKQSVNIFTLKMSTQQLNRNLLCFTKKKTLKMLKK